MIDLRKMKEEALRNVLTISEDEFSRACARVLNRACGDNAHLVLIGAALMADLQNDLFGNDEEGR